jgi:hypothetical protein
MVSSSQQQPPEGISHAAWFQEVLPLRLLSFEPSTSSEGGLLIDLGIRPKVGDKLLHSLIHQQFAVENYHVHR